MQQWNSYAKKYQHIHTLSLSLTHILGTKFSQEVERWNFNANAIAENVRNHKFL